MRLEPETRVLGVALAAFATRYGWRNRFRNVEANDLSESNEVLDGNFTELVREHHVPLRAFVRSLGVDPEWVDDLAQEAFLVAFRERSSFNQQGDIGKWLRGIARNLVRNELRKDARRRRILHSALSELAVGAAEAHEESETWSCVRMSFLRNCIEQLPPKSRQMISERYGGGWLAGDLAQQLAMSAAAVRQALTRIRRQLKRCIDHQVAEIHP